jgi:hypothetical protein
MSTAPGTLPLSKFSITTRVHRVDLSAHTQPDAAGRRRTSLPASLSQNPYYIYIKEVFLH